MKLLFLPRGADSYESFGRALESTHFFRKWVGIAILIGIVAGLGAIVFSAAIHYATLLFLGMGVGYLPPDPAGEGTNGIMPIGRPWLLPLITALGGLLSGLIVFNFAPEAEGHGTDSAIAAIHYHQGRMRARVPLIKVIASAITIGSGGSAGREGPTAQISAGFGSLLADVLHLSDDDRRTAVAVGIGAGIGAIFRAPLGGAVLAAEILYLHDIEVEAIIPSLIASIVGYSIYGMATGFTPVFGNLSQFSYAQPIQLVYYAILGLLCGGVGILYARCFYATTHLVHRIQIPRAVKPAIGGFLVGCLGLVMPEVLGMGYGWVQLAMTPTLLGLPWWVILLVPFAKILATSFSIGSGGSGGIFGPGMVIGGMLGGLCWRFGHALLPGMPPESAPFVIIGMMALFGGIAHAPLAVMLMVAEMTGNLSLLAPAMLAVGVSYLVVGNDTIYASQINSRADSPAHRARLRFPLLSSLTVAEAQEPAPPLLPATMVVADAASLIEKNALDGAPVVDSAESLVGVFTRGDLRNIPEETRSTMHVAEAMNPRAEICFPSDSLDVALETLATKRVRWLVVVADRESRQVAGVLTAADVVSTYRRALNTVVRGVSGVAGGGDLVDLTVGDDSAVTHHTLADLHLMPETVIVSIRRDEQIVLPTARTELRPGDVVTILNHGRDQDTLQRLFGRPVVVPESAIAGDLV